MEWNGVLAVAGCFFDNAWLRLSNVNFTHRMNRYEREVADRLGHHLLRDNAGETQPEPLARDGVHGEEEAGAVPAPTVVATVVDTPTALIESSVGAGTVEVLR